MLGKAEWFQKRKYGGWGLSPRTWQGWVYIFIFIGVLLGFHILPFWDTVTRTIFTATWALILFFDTLYIMATLQKDELERQHEAIAERNASWAMVTVLTVGILYQIISSGLEQSVVIDPFLAIALVGGLIVKSVSYIMLERA